MKTIAVLGCSNSTGEETRDWELDPEYYTKTNATHRDWYQNGRLTAFLKFFNENPEIMLTSDPNGVLDSNEWDLFVEATKHNTGSLDAVKDLSWNTYNDQFSWPALLDKHEDYKVYNFSTRGAGLSHFEIVYNAERSMKEYDFKKRHITDPMYKPVEKYIRKGNTLSDNGMIRYYNHKWNFKDILDNADILIWQFSGEPRYALTHVIDQEVCKYNTDLSRMFSYAANLESLLGWLPHYLEGDVLKTYEDWFTYYYDLSTNFTRSLTWIEQLMEIRALKGKKNMIFPIHKTYTSRLGFNAINNEHTKSYGFDIYERPDSGSCPGIFVDELKLAEEDLVFIAKPGPEQYTAKYSHPSEKGHRAISEWVDKVIRRDLL